MSLVPRRRMLVAVTPRLLGEALARALGNVGGYEVVLHPLDDPGDLSLVSTGFDFGLVTGDLPDGVSVDVLVRLPDTPTGAGIGRVRSGLGEREILIEDIAAIRGLMADVGVIPDAAC